MKLQTVFGLLALALGAGVARANSTNYTFTLNSEPPVTLASSGLILDGSGVGLDALGVVSGVEGTLSSITVGLNLSGGYNGDLYAMLVSPGGTRSALLMNSPGVTPGNPFGYAGSGMNLTLGDAGTDGNIQTTTQPVGTVFTGDFTAATALDSAFTGLTPNGTWHLYIEDQSLGGGSLVLNGWSLYITEVPEPNVATLCLVGFMAFGYRYRRTLGFGRRVWQSWVC